MEHLTNTQAEPEIAPAQDAPDELAPVADEPQGEAVGIAVADELDFSRPDVSWPLVASALRECAAFADDLNEGSGADFTCDVSSARRLRAAIELSEVALLWLREDYNGELAHSLNWHRGLINELAPLTFEGEPQGDENPQGTPLEADAREAVAA